jgi:porin
MKGVDRRKFGCIALMLGILGVATLSTTRVAAQVPVIIPGLPGANLPAGARPAPTLWPYTDLPGAEGPT